ncbi:hypothetical protein NW768_002695 [Fusarium equiseti]|uniref:Haloacid dehalogenase n=1 Tax=Fusarium equiseti TaxID=61235 RepID=A0ABQ8RJW3_FUSEQ|nr:hypothetical protein NW768_002695 [Fusarium equiseti]
MSNLSDYSLLPFDVCGTLIDWETGVLHGLKPLLEANSKHYKLVVLSNVNRESFSGSNSGPLQGVPFDLVITAQDVGSYKPDPRNFEYMLHEVESKFGIPKEKVLQTAQSQYHDHQPAKKFGTKSSWIERPGAIMGNRKNPVYDWKFATWGDMADALEKELASK